MATSKFVRILRDGTGIVSSGNTVEIIPQANTYPTGALSLSESVTKLGYYSRDAVPDGEYKIYVDSTLYEEHIWHGEQRITADVTLNNSHRNGDGSDHTDVALNTASRHAHDNKGLLDTYTQTNANIVSAIAQKHEHENKALLDTYNQTNSDISGAILSKHSHSNKATLDTYTEEMNTIIAMCL